MNWKDILKDDLSYRQRQEINEQVTEIVNGLEDTSWEISDFNYYLGGAIFNHKEGKLKVSGKVPGINSLMLRSSLSGRSTASVDVEDKKEFVRNMFKPSFRSLDWFLEVITPIDNITNMKASNSLTVNGTSGNDYNIELLSIKSSGCYEVTTNEGFYICIEMAESKPVGDNLLGLTLGLLNDEQSSSEIEGLEDYIIGEVEIECAVCGDEYELAFKVEGSFTCDTCGAENLLDNISFEPRFSATNYVADFTGPFQNHLNLEDAHWQGDLFLDRNALFRLDDPDDFQLTVVGEPFRELVNLDGEIYMNDNEFFTSDGYEINLEEYLREDFSRMKTIVRQTNYDYDDLYDILGFENLAGNLWNDGVGGYFSTYGDFELDIENIWHHSGLEEEKFIMEAMESWGLDESEVLELFDYEDDGVYWTKDGKKYELDNGEMVEINDEGITKNLSSKAVLPINMKWTDYLKKTSNEEAEDWESALKSFISDGKKLGIPLSVMELLKLAKEATTSQSEGFETLHRPTFSEEEEEDV